MQAGQGEQPRLPDVWCPQGRTADVRGQKILQGNSRGGMRDARTSAVRGRRGPILVTGSHRSGSTWVGKMLALSPFVAYIDEVFNPDPGHPLSDRGTFRHAYTYITRENEDDYVEGIRDVLQFRFGGRAARFGGFLPNRRFLHRLTYRVFSLPRPLLKDPIAAMSAEWLAQKFGMDVVVLVRHPAAFAASLLRMKWRFDFDAFWRQENLMEDWLYPFEEEIRRPPEDPIEEAALAWLCIYHVLDGYVQRHPEWIVKRHEDVSSAPGKEFAEMYERLGIPFSGRVGRIIDEYTARSNPVAAPGNVEHHLHRDSQALVKRWKRTLSTDDISRIRDTVDVLAGKYYTEQDW